MANYIYEPRALELLGAIEGDAWTRLQHAKPYLGTSFFAWLKAWQDKQASPYQGSVEPLSDFMEVSHDGAIYGEGGWHRWRVAADGELILLGWSSREARIQQVKALGFNVL